MKELFPLLIVIVASLAVSLLKKKPASPGKSGHLPQESPWDGLLREEEKKTAHTTQAREYRTLQRDRGNGRMTAVPKSVRTEQRHQKAPSSLLYEADEALEQMANTEGQEEIEAGNVTDTVKTEVKENVFEGGFDPRMAVLYSEILHPKYQEYMAQNSQEASL